MQESLDAARCVCAVASVPQSLHMAVFVQARAGEGFSVHEARARLWRWATAWTVVEAVAVPPAVAEDLVVLHAADDVFHPGADLAAGGVVLLLAREQIPPGTLAVRYGHAAVER